jgi:hypothetical protein
VNIFIKKNIFIPFNSRCRKSHFDEYGDLDEAEINKIIIIQQRVKLTGEQLSKLFELIRNRDIEKSTIFNQFSNFEKAPQKLFMNHTGFTKDEFFFILNELKSLKNSPARSREQALAVYLTWLKTDIPQFTLSAFFGIESRQKISNMCFQVREAFKKDFVPKFLGCNSLKRVEWLSKNTELVKELYTLSDDQFCLIADGTYLYCQKSENNKLQRLLYSGQKKRHLIKPFVVCSSNGYIIDVFGPFAATANVASILLHLMSSLKDNSSLKDVALPNDLFIVDRGFRDALKYGLLTKAPACKLFYYKINEDSHFTLT